MARPFQKICDLSEKSKFIKIAVRITGLWVVVNAPKTGHLEMIVMDAQGDEIQISVRGAEYTEWKQKLKERKTYVMENFKIVKSVEKFKPCKHDFKMSFIAGTIMREKEIQDIPPFKFNFANYQDILASKLPPHLFIDVIGLVDDMTTDKIKRVVLVLKDQSQTSIQCTIWDEYAKKFLNFWENKKESELIVVIIRRARIKPANMGYEIQLSNGYNNVTEVITDQALPEVNDFKAKMKELPIVLAETSGELTHMSQRSSFSMFTDLEKFMFKAEAICIEDLCNLSIGEEKQYLTVAKGDEVLPQKGGWYYDGCFYCPKKRPGPIGKMNDISKLDAITVGPFTCVDPKCNKYNEQSCPRYKLSIILKGENEEGSVEATFFDEHCNAVLGISALDLDNKMRQLEDYDRNSYPLVLDDMCGKTFALRLKVNPRFSSISVMKCSKDSEYINAILQLLPKHEGTSKMKDENSKVKLLMSSNDPNGEQSNKLDYKDGVESSHSISMSAEDDSMHFPTQSLSATADHDPEQLNNITPSKREFPDPDSIMVEDNASAQLSRTKVKKQPKLKKTINLKNE